VWEPGDESSISNWATLSVNACINSDNPIAWIDSVVGMRGYPISVNILENDFHPLGDSIFVLDAWYIIDSVLSVSCPFFESTDYFRIPYTITDSLFDPLRMDRGYVFVELLNNEFYDSLDVNNISARFNCYENHFWDEDESKAKFFVPKQKRTTSMFTNTLWIGGLDDDGNVHIASERYRQSGIDYWHGPISDIYDSLYDSRWFHLWKLNRTDILYHKTHWWKPDYEPIKDILSWPGNGYIELGQSKVIAPFEDKNENGIYEPLLGDAPQIKGDQALFFVFNDVRKPHTESEGLPLGIEVHAMAYAFDKPADSTLWNSIFVNYKIINTSDTVYNDTYVGMFSDFDIGYAWDDYMGCDVEGGFYYGYNGDEHDPTTVNGNEDTIYGYGDHPPTMGILILGGSELPSDGIDNPKVDINNQPLCDNSFNGLNFGDGVPDNERMGLTNFMYCNIGTWPPYEYTPAQMYGLMKSEFYSGEQILYGGNGHITSGGVGPQCRYLYPGSSDPVNWGTYGMWPNGGYNQPGQYWTEGYVGNIPGDRRGLGSSGPFTFYPGDTVEFDVAFVWARDYEGTAWSSVELLKERCAYIKDKFENEEVYFSNVNHRQEGSFKVKVYPNPVTDKITIKFSENIESCYLQILDSRGYEALNEQLTNTKRENISVKDLKPGLYFIRIFTGQSCIDRKFIKI